MVGTLHEASTPSTNLTLDDRCRAWQNAAPGDFHVGADLTIAERQRCFDEGHVQ